MKKQYIKPEIWILDSDDSMILCTSIYQETDEDVHGHNGARGGGFFEDEYEDADDDYGW